MYIAHMRPLFFRCFRRNGKCSLLSHGFPLPCANEVCALNINMCGVYLGSRFNHDETCFPSRVINYRDNDIIVSTYRSYLLLFRQSAATNLINSANKKNKTHTFKRAGVGYVWVD